MSVLMPILAEASVHLKSRAETADEARHVKLGPAIGIMLGLALSLPIWAIVGWRITRLF